MTEQQEIFDAEADAIDPMEHVSGPANSVVAKAGQSMAAQREQANSSAIASMSPTQMAYQLIQSGADISAVKEMLAVSRELAAEQARRAFDDAIAQAKAEIPIIGKNARGHNSKRYADFSAYASALKPVLAKYGLSYRFRTEQTDRITVTCVLSHKDGHSEENSLSGPADTSGNKNAIQSIGSTLTYLQRYTLVQALGLAASEDDDGGRSGRTPEEDTPISADEAANIRNLIEATETDIAKFCAYMGVEAITEIPRPSYQRAVAMLEKKRRAA